MKTPGTYLERQPGTLKDAEAALVTACGGMEKASSLTRVRPSQMQRYTAPGEPDCHMPVDVVLALELHCGVPHVTRFLAFEAQSIVVSVAKGDHASFNTHLSAIGRESGKMYAEACAALADGTMTPKEASRVETEALKTVTALSGLIGDLRAARTVR